MTEQFRYLKKLQFRDGDKVAIGEIVKVNATTGKSAPGEKHTHIKIHPSHYHRLTLWEEVSRKEYEAQHGLVTPIDSILTPEEIPMSTTIRVVTQINGANEDTFSTAQLLELIKGAQNEIASLEEIEAVSTFVSKQINEQRDVIDALVTLLDAR